MDTDDTIETLNDLIETSKDGEYGFRSSAEYLQRSDLKQLFQSRAEECRRAASELQTLVTQLGGSPDEGGSASGAMHRGWVAVKGSLAGYSDMSILEDAERGEDATLDRYLQALEANLPTEARALVEHLFDGVKRSHAHLRALRDKARATAS